MAKLSAKGCYVVERYQYPYSQSVFALRSDGYLLRRAAGGGWQLFRRFASVEEAQEYARRVGLIPMGGYASGKPALRSYGIR